MLAATRGARRVLEIGCGTGRLLARVRAPVRVGIDIAPAMLARARAHIDHLVVADGHCLPFAAGSFDVVLAGKGVFRYLDYERAFAECARVLSPSGRLVVHQYAARTWSLRSLLGHLARSPRPGANQRMVHELDSVDELVTPAVQAGLRPSGVWLWRPLRFRPYLVAVPAWLPGRAWSHCVVQFDRL